MKPRSLKDDSLPASEIRNGDNQDAIWVQVLSKGFEDLHGVAKVLQDVPQGDNVEGAQPFANRLERLADQLEALQMRGPAKAERLQAHDVVALLGHPVRKSTVATSKVEQSPAGFDGTDERSSLSEKNTEERMRVANRRAIRLLERRIERRTGDRSAVVRIDQ